MKWEENLKQRIEGEENQEKLHRLCSEAFSEGREIERALAIEAYRLCCKDLFGNRCMNHSRSKFGTQAVCVGNCSYLKRYEFELFKIEN